MNKDQLTEAAKAYFENNPKAEVIYLLKNGLQCASMDMARKTAKRLNLGDPYEFVKKELLSSPKGGGNSKATGSKKTTTNPVKKTGAKKETTEKTEDKK